MTRKKSGFITFVCSLIPGAGEMYLGFMKEGISIMGLFFAMFFCSAYLNIKIIGMAMPILWFYSVFNVNNKAGLSDEEFYALEDDYLFYMDRILPNGRLNGRQSKIFGWIILFLGVSMIWRETVGSILTAVSIYISEEFGNILGDIIYDIPRYVVAAILIVSGIRLIGNKKKELDLELERGTETESDKNI